HDAPLLALSAAGCVATLHADRPGEARTSPLLWLVLAYAASAAVSMLYSDQPRDGVATILSLLPGMLMFLLVATRTEGIRGVAAIYSSLCIAGLLLAIGLLAAAWRLPNAEPAALVRALGSPAWIVPNDAILLACLAPLAVTVPRRWPSPLA